MIYNWAAALRAPGSPGVPSACGRPAARPPKAFGVRSLPQALLLAIACLLLAPLPVAALSISLDHPEALQQQTTTAHALADARELLAFACQCPVSYNDRQADVRLLLPLPAPGADTLPSPFAAGRDYPYYHYPRHGYRWDSRRQDGRILLALTTPTHQGIANGLYGLLQEKLGFLFIHPRETVKPCFEQWPLPEAFSFEGRPLFDKKGFHLHTMHPLELTEPLLDPGFPQAQAMVREYIDWLARNQQNFFDFNLLEIPDLERWVAHARQFVAYAHERGILCSIDVSLHMVQQRAYQLVEFPPKDFTPFKKQIDRKLDLLLSAGFDYINMEFSIAEFVGGLEKLRNRLRAHVEERIAAHPGVKLVGRQHVVKPEDELGGGRGQDPDGHDDPSRGLLVHTVMCYALTDPSAPVYELEDFSHLHARLRTENEQRETWFYPESAYWITFDNSVPMLHLPYLDARYRDIRTVHSERIPGHVTFSSGWEWGYWMVDWSIARWTWEYRENGRPLPTGPLDAAAALFPDPEPQRLLSDALSLQREALIRQNLLRYLCPPSFADELPERFSKQFQPRPEPSLEKVYREAAPGQRAALEAAQRDLAAYASALGKTVQSMRALHSGSDTRYNGLRGKLWEELTVALEVGALLAEHHAHWYGGFVAAAYDEEGMEEALEKCRNIRETALAKVEEMEQGYRYTPRLIAREMRSHTAYPYGYLYPVSNLHFWQRREKQLETGNFGDPFFMNIWDPAKIAGLKK